MSTLKASPSTVDDTTTTTTTTAATTTTTTVANSQTIKTANLNHVLKPQISVTLIDSIELVPTSVQPSEQVTKVYAFKDVIGTYAFFF